MSEFRVVSTYDPIRSSEHNALLDHGLEKAASYIIRKNGGYYEAIKGGTSSGAGMITYGGSGNAGGATGTDASAVIQAALDAVTSGGIVHLKQATYPITTILSMDSETTLEGEGKGTLLQLGADLGSIIRLYTGASYSTTDTVIRNLEFDGVSASYSKPCVYFISPTNAYFLNCSFTGYQGILGWLAAAATANNVVVDKCIFDTLTNYAFSISPNS